MTSNDADQPSPRPLSEEERAALFARTNVAPGARRGSPITRAPIPSKAVIFVAAAFAVLGLGGAILEHFYGGAGRALPDASSTTVPDTANTGPQLSSSLRDFMGLRELPLATASPISLTDQSNETWNLTSVRGKAVVVTFLNSACNDICPIEGREIRLAATLLGARGARVDFVIVNSDPDLLAVSARPAVLTATGLVGRSTVQFLTGSLRQLNRVWIHYGLAVNVGSGPTQVEHNNLMYFITPNGRLASLAVPFANESATRTFTLSNAEVNRFARGIVNVAVSLLK